MKYRTKNEKDAYVNGYRDACMVALQSLDHHFAGLFAQNAPMVQADIVNAIKTIKF